MLLARIYEVLPLLCPACGGQRSILAFLTDPPVVSAILLHLDRPHRPPPLSPARSPPQGDFLLDQTPAFDRGPRATDVAWGEGLADAEPEPDFRTAHRTIPMAPRGIPPTKPSPRPLARPSLTELSTLLTAT